MIGWQILGPQYGQFVLAVTASYQVCNERSNDAKNLGPVVACFVIIDCTLVIIFHFLLTYTLPGNAVNPGCPVGWQSWFESDAWVCASSL